MEEFIKNQIGKGPELIDSYVLDRNTQKPLLYRSAFYRLKKYVNSFLGGETEERFIILCGLRGIGKTTLVCQVYKYLMVKKGMKKENLFYLPVDNLKTLLGDGIAKTIRRYAEIFHKSSIIGIKDKTFIFIDEAHFDKDWSLAVKSIYDSSKNVFIIATGSSAIALNMGVDAARRSTKEPLFPLNFSEYAMLKKGIFPTRGTLDTIKKLTLTGDKNLVKEVNSKEEETQKEFKKKRLDMHKELNDFLQCGGFTIGLGKSKEYTYIKVKDLVDRIITTDLSNIYAFDSESQSYTFRIIGALALKAPGETSHPKLAKRLGISPATVGKILEALEKTHLLFSIKPQPNGAGSWAGKPWKYYFISSTILSTLRFHIGISYEKRFSDGLLFETAVAASLRRMVETLSHPIETFYDSNKKTNVDFLIQNKFDGSVIPVEVGLNKSNKQIREAISRFNSRYGILITNLNQTEFEDNILKIPITTFLYA